METQQNGKMGTYLTVCSPFLIALKASSSAVIVGLTMRAAAVSTQTLVRNQKMSWLTLCLANNKLVGSVLQGPLSLILRALDPWRVAVVAFPARRSFSPTLSSATVIATHLLLPGHHVPALACCRSAQGSFFPSAHLKQGKSLQVHTFMFTHLVVT